MIYGSFEVVFFHALPKSLARTKSGRLKPTSSNADIHYSPIPTPRASMAASLWFARCNAKLAGIAMGRALRQLRADDTILIRSAR
jgi:hypothetical protein